MGMADVAYNRYMLEQDGPGSRRRRYAQRINLEEESSSSLDTSSDDRSYHYRYQVGDLWNGMVNRAERGISRGGDRWYRRHNHYHEDEASSNNSDVSWDWSQDEDDDSSSWYLGSVWNHAVHHGLD